MDSLKESFSNSNKKKLSEELNEDSFDIAVNKNKYISWKPIGSKLSQIENDIDLKSQFAEDSDNENFKYTDIDTDNDINIGIGIDNNNDNFDDSEDNKVVSDENIDVIGALLNNNDDDSDDAIDVNGNGSVDKVLKHLLDYGVENNASDIHIEIDSKGLVLRFRIDGILKHLDIKSIFDKISDTFISDLVLKIKSISNLDINEKNIPQNGHFKINYIDDKTDKQYNVDFRVATCPTVLGENLIIHILNSQKQNINLDSLNHSKHVLEPFKELLKYSSGIILISGHAGSGKSSTLYAALKYIYHPEIKIITAENFNEYYLEGITQTLVNPKINMTYPRLLHSFMRADPDVIVIDEIRDAETAKAVFEIAQKGYLIIATINANDSISTIFQLLDLNISKSQIASTLIGVIGQALVRKFCPNCKNKYVPDYGEINNIFNSYPNNIEFYQSEGCESCNYLKYKNRIVISELLLMDSKLSNALNNNLSKSEIKNLIMEMDIKTIVDDGISKLTQTTISEIKRILPHEMIKDYKQQQNKAVTPDKNSNDKDTNDKNNTAILISDPQNEKSLINDLLEKYKEAKKSLDKNSKDTDPLLFNIFITKSYSNISKRFKTSSISFNINTINRKNCKSINIEAIPILEQNENFSNTGKRYIISNANIKDITKDMFINYKALIDLYGVKTEQLDMNLFKKYITQNYDKICKLYQCKNVYFNFEFSKAENKVLICAVPKMLN